MSTAIPALLHAPAPTMSLELFPPRTPASERGLWRTVEELSSAMELGFVSVTYGAGGSTQDRTLDLVRSIMQRTGLRTVMHLTCVSATTSELTSLARRMADHGITDVLALRGDPPDGPGGVWTQVDGGLAHAAELVRLLRAVGPFEIGVAAFPEGHPESPSRESDVRRLADKCAQGAGYAVTQFFFDVKQYTALVEDLRAIGCDTPVVPGVLPVIDPRKARGFAQKVGATIPADLDERFRAVEHDPDAALEVGIDVATEMALDLLASGAPGLHFYTMNRSTATREIHRRLVAAGALDGAASAGSAGS